jgi:hypothetical protein
VPAPPKARQGQPAASRGRPVIAGVAAHAQILTSYSPSSEIWDELRILSTNSGFDRLRRTHGPQFTEPVFAHFCAYLRQAETYYSTAQAMPAESRPLVAYYCLLNLTKALLACKAPKAIAGKVFHGLSDDFHPMQRYRFTQEWSKIQKRGVFRDLATRTGAKYCHPDGHRLQIQRLSPYLAEVSSLHKEATGIAPKLVPAETIQVWEDGTRLWLRVEIDRSELARRNVGPASLPQRAARFGSVFRLVQSDTPTASYESTKTWNYGARIANAFPETIRAFESALIHANRHVSGRRHYLVLSERKKLLSQEAVTFLFIYHLSNMVRYRPEQVEKLSEGAFFFFFTTWVPRALENSLLGIASRLLGEEVWIG